MERILELDFALRDAITEGDGETAARLATRHAEAIRHTMETADDESKAALARQISDLLARNIELARTVRDALRSELTSVMQQRKLSAGAAPAQPRRCFTA